MDTQLRELLRQAQVRPDIIDAFELAGYHTPTAFAYMAGTHTGLRHFIVENVVKDLPQVGLIVYAWEQAKVLVGRRGGEEVRGSRIDDHGDQILTELGQLRKEALGSLTELELDFDRLELLVISSL